MIEPDYGPWSPREKADTLLASCHVPAVDFGPGGLHLTEYSALLAGNGVDQSQAKAAHQMTMPNVRLCTPPPFLQTGGLEGSVTSRWLV